MGRYLEIADRALSDIENQSLEDSKADFDSPSHCEIGEISELSPDSGEWSELLENKNGELAEDEIPTAKDMVMITEMRERGEVPDHYTATTKCRRCGPVPIFEGVPTAVDGCPWCFNRIKRLPMPKHKYIEQQ